MGSPIGSCVEADVGAIVPEKKRRTGGVCSGVIEESFAAHVEEAGIVDHGVWKRDVAAVGSGLVFQNDISQSPSDTATIGFVDDSKFHFVDRSEFTITGLKRQAVVNLLECLF